MELNSIDAERACTKLILGFAYHLDHRHFAEVAALFTEDGTFDRPGMLAKGREEIAALWHGRPEAFITRHVCGPPFFTLISAEEVCATTYFMLYQAEHAGAGFPDQTRVAAVAEYLDCFRREGGSWKFASRKVAVGFLAKD